MNDVGPSRSPLPRVAPILAIGVTIVLVGGFGLGVYVLRKPVAPQPTMTASLGQRAETILPEVTAPHQPDALSLPRRPDPPSLPEGAPAPAVPEALSPPVPAVSTTPSIAPAPPPAQAEKPARAAQAARPALPAGGSAHPKWVAAPRAAAALSVTRRKAVTKSPPAAVPHKSLPVPAGDGRWGVRLGAFQSDDHAKLLVETLVFHGHPAEIAHGHDKNGRNWFFVQTPGYQTRADAETVAKVLARRERVPTVIFERAPEPGG